MERRILDVTSANPETSPGKEVTQNTVYKNFLYSYLLEIQKVLYLVSFQEEL
jgi:hypothetical protein